MEHFFLNLFQSNFVAWRHWGLLIIFIVAYLESIPLIGMLIPGQIFIILAGFLVKLQLFSFPVALLISSVGAMLGDLSGFLIGRKYNKDLPSFVHKILKKEHLEKTKHLIEKHSVKTIFIGRLHSLTRTITPFAAGTTNVEMRRFLAADLLSAFIWAFLSLAIGYIFGKSFELAAAFIGKFIMVATLITILLIIIVKVLREHRHRINTLDFFLFGAVAITIYLFAITAQDVATGKIFHILDMRVAHIVESLRTYPTTLLMVILTTLGDPLDMTTLSLLLLTWFLVKKRYSDASILVIAVGLGDVLINILKANFEKIRPIPQLIKVTGSSFPSGHAGVSIMIASVLSYTIIRHMKDSTRKSLLYVLVFSTSICIGLSRVYLNVHWASDVLAGFFFGLAWSTLTILIVRLIVRKLKRSKINHELPSIP